MATAPASTPSDSNAASPSLRPLASGTPWIARFATSTQVCDCAEPFRSKLTGFIAALRAAGASVNVAATLRPAQRAYLMHWCWCIAKAKVDPRTVPALDGVAITWAHLDDQGGYDADASRAAAQAMANAYGMQHLSVAPALGSKHISGTAVDMAIAWAGALTINNQDGTSVTITSLPRMGMNSDLKKVGATYGVFKFVGGATDIPHWSDDGH
jgi:hypothetical protein